MKLEFQTVSLSYGKKPVLAEVSFLVDGGITVLMGRNGAGKSSLLRCLTGEMRAYQGQILLDGTPVRALSTGERAKRVGYLPQELPCPRVTVRELVAFGRSPYLPLVGKLTDEDAAAVETALRLVALEGMADRLVDSLSGGERQKAFLAMVLAQETPLVVLDEPTAQLDVAARLAFCDLLKQLNVTTGKVFLVVMHELPEALRLADRVVVLQEGRVAFSGTPEACLQEGVPETYFAICISGDRDTGYAVTPK